MVPFVRRVARAQQPDTAAGVGISAEWLRNGRADAILNGSNPWREFARPEVRPVVSGGFGVYVNQGRRGGKYTFELPAGTADVSIPIQNRTQFDVEFWYGVRTSNTGSYQYLWGNHDGNLGHCVFAQHPSSSGSWGWYPGDGPSIVSAGEALPIGEESVIVLARDLITNEVRLYRNGVRRITYPGNGVRENGPDFTIGSAGKGLYSNLSTGQAVFLAGRLRGMGQGWSDDDVRRFSANPWQIFESERRFTFAPEVTTQPGPITGIVQASDAGADAAAISGSVVVSGIVAGLEAYAGDGVSSTGSVVVSGAVLAAEAYGSDAAASSGSVLISGAVLAAEAYAADSVAIIGAGTGPTTTGFVDAAEAFGTDSAAISGSVLISGVLAALEAAGADSAHLTGTALVPVRRGALQAAETGQDGAIVAGRVRIRGSVDCVDPGADFALIRQRAYVRAPAGSASWGARAVRDGDRRPSNIAGGRRPSR